MHLCDSCHTLGGCRRGYIEGTSGGRCEECGYDAECFDCHSYDFRNVDRHRHAPKANETPSTEDQIADLLALRNETS